MSTTQPEFTMSQYASKDDMIGAMRQHIAELESRVQELGQMARDANSRRVIELEAELAAMRAGGEPVAEMVPYHTPSGKRVAVISRFQHLPIGTKLYTHPQPAAQDAERYRLLTLGVDVIQVDDEFLSDDTTTWGTDPNGVFVGMPYQGYALLPARRKVDAAIAAQGENKNMSERAFHTTGYITPAQPISKDERALRRLLCAKYEHLPYMDDGEAHGQTLEGKP